LKQFGKGLLNRVGAFRKHCCRLMLALGSAHERSRHEQERDYIDILMKNVNAPIFYVNRRALLAICGYLTSQRLQSDNLRDQSNVNEIGKIVDRWPLGVSSI
jgi:hypothetical protein